jgi:glucosamine-6-phosphate deaminase
LDEYIGLPQAHPATFRRFLEEHLVSKTGIAHCHWLTEESVDAISAAVSSQPIDIAFLGIGENAHLAFNDPPADFDTEQPYIRVALDEDCRSQQVHEGWFAALPQVPAEAISMSIKQILKSKELVVVVPGPRKAEAVRASFEGGITRLVPASILRDHPNALVYLDEQSAALLPQAAIRIGGGVP